MTTRDILNVRRMRRARRVRSAIEGTATMPRLTVFRSNRSFYAQLIDDIKSHTLVSVSMKELKADKMTKSQVAEQLGVLLGEKAKKASIDKVVFDRGRYPFHGRVKAFAEAARKAGLIF